MSKTTTKQFFVKRLYNGFILTEEGKETAVESEEALQVIFMRKITFLNSAITTKTTCNFGLVISLEENVPQTSNKNYGN